MERTHDLAGRLPFALPEFARTSWTSDTTRDEWRPRLAAVSKALEELEVGAALERVRRVVLLTVSQKDLPERQNWTERAGLSAIVLRRGAAQERHSYQINRPANGHSAPVRLAIGEKEAVRELLDSYDAFNVEKIGSILGYPACCRAFYRTTRVQLGLKDTVWPMVSNGTATSYSDDQTAECFGSHFCNILWRCHDVRAVPHRPCSFSCEETALQGSIFVANGRARGFQREMDDLEAVLNWPVSWSILHGICELKTPIFKLVTGTDATRSTHRVNWMGSGYPKEGATGSAFPFRETSRRRRSTERGEGPSPTNLAVPSWRANEFPSQAAMDRAHASLLLAIGELLPHGGSVLDLGCGDGSLLEKINRWNGAEPHGIDKSPRKIAVAREKMPDFRDNFHVADIYDLPVVRRQRGAVVIMSARRLEEEPAKAATSLLATIYRASEFLLLYLYREANDEADLETIARRLDLVFAVPVKRDNSVEWAVIRGVRSSASAPMVGV